MLQEIIRPFKSPWVPLHMIKKVKGEWHPCGDYHKLNAVTIPERYLVPHIQDCTQIFYGKSNFSTLDFAYAYHQFPINLPGIPKTAVIFQF